MASRHIEPGRAHDDRLAANLTRHVGVTRRLHIGRGRRRVTHRAGRGDIERGGAKDDILAPDRARDIGVAGRPDVGAGRGAVADLPGVRDRQAGGAQDDVLAQKLARDTGIAGHLHVGIGRARPADRPGRRDVEAGGAKQQIGAQQLTGDRRRVRRPDVGLGAGAGHHAGAGVEIVAGDDEQIRRVDREAADDRRGMAHGHVRARGQIVAPADDPARAARQHPDLTRCDQIRDPGHVDRAAERLEAGEGGRADIAVRRGGEIEIGERDRAAAPELTCH